MDVNLLHQLPTRASSSSFHQRTQKAGGGIGGGDGKKARSDQLQSGGTAAGEQGVATFQKKPTTKAERRALQVPFNTIHFIA